MSSDFCSVFEIYLCKNVKHENYIKQQKFLKNKVDNVYAYAKIESGLDLIRRWKGPKPLGEKGGECRAVLAKFDHLGIS